MTYLPRLFSIQPMTGNDYWNHTEQTNLLDDGLVCICSSYRDNSPTVTRSMFIMKYIGYKSALWKTG